MKLYSAYGALLYEGQAPNFKSLIQNALEDNINLKHADFSNMDLSQSNLDGYDLSEAIFKNTNLTDANLSEAILKNCLFQNTRLFDTCFCETDFTGSRFIDCLFGCTDFSYATLDNCLFEGPGLFDVHLHEAVSMKCALYKWHGQIYPMSTPPLLCRVSHKKFMSLDDTTLSQTGPCSDDIHKGFQKLKSIK